LSKTQVRVGPEARRDLRKLTLWLHGEADSETASRFAQAAISGFAALAQSPGIGPAVPSAHRDLAGLRKWRVPGFPNHLIFYRRSDSGIEIVRVLHAAQDWWALLDVN
jgi:toxin ParE1/3/4